MTPDRAPTVHELLAFYLEAGVDCALMDEPVNRVSDDSIAVPRDAPQAPPVRTAPVATPVAKSITYGDAAPALIAMQSASAPAAKIVFIMRLPCRHQASARRSRKPPRP